MTGWDADATETIEGTCQSWCTSMLNIVPAKVAGTWRMGSGDLDADAGVSDGVGHARDDEGVGGRLSGEQITFKAGDTEYTGKVTGDRMEGTATTSGKTQSWSATKSK